MHASLLITLPADCAVSLLQTGSQDHDTAKRKQTRLCVESEDLSLLHTDDAALHRRIQPHTAHSLAVKAVERAQLRYKRRTHACTSKEQHMPVTDGIATAGVWAELPGNAELQQSCTQPRLDR